MRNVLGFPLERAEVMLEAEGIQVRREEICCRKGRVGETLRVLAQREDNDGSVSLLYAGFRTDVLTK